MVNVESGTCVSAEESRLAYLSLVQTKACGEGVPCLRDECEHCGPLNELIDRLGEECDRRGCTLARCIYDPPSPLSAS